jgi:potassium/hydrogen antiporter
VHDTQPFALVVFVAAVGGLLAVMVNRLTSRLKVPAPAFMLIAAAVAVKAVPGLEPPPDQTVERLVTVALLCILFDGGMHIGWGRFRAAAAPTALVGVMGTFLTVAGGSLFVHLAVGFSWYLSVLVATAVAPTDPAVVFSVLGLRQIAGRSGTILEGESGANDPVGIALMASLVTAGGLTGDAAGRVALEFALQMAVGLVVGVVGARLLLWFMRRVPLPNEALYPLRVLACVFLLFGATTLLDGSGFLAVFVAGIVLGDERAPYKRDRTLPFRSCQPRGNRGFCRARPHREPLRAVSTRCVDSRTGAGPGLGRPHPTSVRWPVSSPRAAGHEGERLRPLRRTERGGSDPAG